MATVKQLEAEIEHLKEMVGLLRSVLEGQKQSCCHHCAGCNCYKPAWDYPVTSGTVPWTLTTSTGTDGSWTVTS
jgi:hypothetical protein